MTKTRHQILETEFSERFVELMRSRMIASWYKYGDLAKAYPDRVSAIKSLDSRLSKYIETGNTEFLVDAANFCMIEFMRPSHEKASFEPTDSDQSPGRARAKDHKMDHRPNDVVHTNPKSKIARFRE